MKTTTLIAAALISFGIASSVAPAFAGEGNGAPFDSSSYAVTRLSRPAYALRDVGSAQYPNTVGRPGSNLARLGNDQVLPVEANEGAIQTANSLPNGFEDGNVTYATAAKINGWMVAHLAEKSRLASR